MNNQAKLLTKGFSKEITRTRRRSRNKVIHLSSAFWILRSDKLFFSTAAHVGGSPCFHHFESEVILCDGQKFGSVKIELAEP
ncbi:hypothetical protein AAHA92_09084 [Salvia divinorum]|uniref:Uncharacterized protein n=1 Tax=Salvia divinorum TaxID=28513 RepID=A0ABD1HQA5_SALDI